MGQRNENQESRGQIATFADYGIRVRKPHKYENSKLCTTKRFRNLNVRYFLAKYRDVPTGGCAGVSHPPLTLLSSNFSGKTYSYPGKIQIRKRNCRKRNQKCKK